jgi:glutamate synthase (ferredoxin)
MSGGIAYVYDPEDKFTNGLCNTQSIEFEQVLNEDAQDLKALIENHVRHTNSNQGKKLLANWETSLKNFVKVMPTEYKRALKRLETEEQMVEELTIA